MASKNAQNIQKLLDAGVSQSFIDSELAKGDSGLAHGKNIDDKDVQGFIDAWKTANPVKVVSSETQKLLDAAPDVLKNDPSYQSLSADLQAAAVYNYQVQQSNNAQKLTNWNTALTLAQQQAEPYWASIFAVAQANAQLGLDSINGDYNNSIQTLNTAVQRINEDLARNKTNLTLNQQAELASLSADMEDRAKTFQLNSEKLGADKAFQLDNEQISYQAKVESINRNTELSTEQKNQQINDITKNFIRSKDAITGNAADSGMTFSTKKKIAEQQLKTDTEGLVQSTIREYNANQAALAAEKDFATKQNALNVGNIQSSYDLQSQANAAAYEADKRKLQEQIDASNRNYSQQIDALQIEADRGNIDAQNKITELTRAKNESIQALGQEYESKYGTNAAKTLSGYTAIGNIAGSAYEQKAQDIAQRQNTIANELNNASLLY